MLTVGAGLQEWGTGLVLPGVHLVGVAVENKVNVAGHVGIDWREVAALAGSITGSVGGTLVIFGNDDVSEPLTLEALGLSIHGLDRITNGEVGDTGGGDQGWQVVGDSTDDANAHPVFDDDRRRLEGSRHLRGAFGIDVGAEVGAVDVRHDAPGQVLPALVELVVADAIGLDTSCVEHVNGGFVVEGARLEGRAADIVARIEQQDLVVSVGVAGLDDRSEEVGPGSDTAVEVVEIEDVDVFVAIARRGPGATRARCCESRVSNEAARGYAQHR